MKFLKLPALLLVAILTPAAMASAAVDHSLWDRVLKAAVKGQLVDYKAISHSHLADLNNYLDSLATIDAAKLPRDEQLAFYINLYNATMVKAVLDSRAQSPAWRPDADGFAVFKKPIVRTAAGVITLDHLENQLIRPTFNEPRVHVALVCGAVSCPPLSSHAYTGANLETTLADNRRKFLTDGSRNQFDTAGKTARLSRLFDWFAADFGGAARVPSYIEANGGPKITGSKIVFLDYDWALNEHK